MKLHPESHVDHGLSPEQVNYLLELFKDRDAFFIETVELPVELDTVPCGIYGPIMGDAPVPGQECDMEFRGSRAWTSRMCNRPIRQVRQVSVIAGPHTDAEGDHACILYTAYGGPVAPQEPGDPGCRDPEASQVFWNAHALSRGA